MPPQTPPPPPPLADPSTASKRKRQQVDKSLNGEKEARRANYMRKILNDNKATKASSFQKRKPTLKKKAHELQTYCDVSICMVCYDSNGNVDMWPESQKEVENMINGYKYTLKEDEKRKNNIIGLLESKKKKLEKKMREDRAKSLEEVVEPLSKMIDGLSGDALWDTVTRLDAKIEYLQERIKVLKGDSEKKEIKDVGDYGSWGYNGQNIGQVGLALPRLEDSNGNCFVEPESDARGPVMMIDNKASLEMADFGSIWGQSCVGTDAVASGADPVKLEDFDFDMPTEGCTPSNSMVEIGNNALLDPYSCNSFGFGQVGTNFGVVPQSYLTNGYLTPRADGAFNPFFQDMENNVNAVSGKLEFSDFHLGVNNKSGLFDENCNFGFDHQVHGRQDQHPQEFSDFHLGANKNGLFGKNCNFEFDHQVQGSQDQHYPQASKMINQTSPLGVWRPSTTLHPFGSWNNRCF